MAELGKTSGRIVSDLRMKPSLSLLLVLTQCLVSSACGPDPSETRAAGVYYFRSFDGKQPGPERPFDEFSVPSPTELSAQRVYYIARYDESGRLTCFQKFRDGKSEWLSRYGYAATDTPVWREYINLKYGRWRRDDPFDGSSSRETKQAIDASTVRSCL